MNKHNTDPKRLMITVEEVSDKGDFQMIQRKDQSHTLGVNDFGPPIEKKQGSMWSYKKPRQYSVV